MFFVTSIYAAGCAAMQVALSVNVIRQRRKLRHALGDGGEFQLTRCIRAQGNFVEYAPMFLILLLLAEAQDMYVLAVHLFGLAFLAGRAMHAYSLLKAEQYDESGNITAFPIWRVRGMVCTFMVLGLLALVVVGQYLLA